MAKSKKKGTKTGKRKPVRRSSGGVLSSLKRPPKKKKKTKKQQPKGLARIWSRTGDVVFWGLVILILGVGMYALSVTDEVQEKFEGRMWNISSKVYSDTMTLLPGQDVERIGLFDRLTRLNYQKTDSKIVRKGEYRAGRDAIDIHLNDFDYPIEKFQGYLLRVRTRGGVIQKLENVTNREEIYSAEIEPVTISRFFGKEREERDLVKYEEIPPELINAVLAVEDRYFYLHPGVNPVSTVRAVITNIVRFGGAPGGSTITQQLVKNFYLSPERTISRKLKEMVRAVVLEMMHSKNEILEAYLNEIYFGQSGSVAICGVGEASRFFFGKNVRSLSLGESALLAALIRSPYAYDPRRAVDRSKARRDMILDHMLDQGLVTEAEHKRAKATTIEVTTYTPQRTVAPYFIDFLREQLSRTYSKEVLISEGLRIFTTLDPRLQSIAERAVRSGLADLEASRKALASDPKNPLQAGIVVIQPQTGYIRAMVGGRDYLSSQFNRVVHARRQPGSVFKPFVYLTGFIRSQTESDFGFTAADLVEDEPITVRYDRKTWSPNNYKNKEYGTVTVRMALEKSINRATVKLAQRIGIDRIVETAEALGIESDLPPYPSLALGTAELTPLEVAQAYAVLASMGIRAAPISIKDVNDGEGNVLEKKTIQVRQVISPQAAYLTTNILKGVLIRGTGASSRALGFDRIAAGKTGTTDDYNDAWFAGYTPDLLAVVWVGFDRDRSANLSGASGALPIWVRFMREALAGQPEEDFPVPPGIVTENIDRLNGLLSVYGCPDTIDESFFADTQPTEKCTEHKDSIIEYFREKYKDRLEGEDR